MELRGSRILVAGASGALGSRLTRALDAEGAHVIGAARHSADITLDFARPDAVIAAARDALGGLDGLVIATGAVAFGGADELPDDIAAELFAVNALGPIALIRAALDDLTSLVVLSAVVAEFPTAGMAAYSASKAALSAYLTALRRERRKHGLTVLDVRPPHLDTAFAEHALHGTPPALPDPADPDALVSAIIDAMAAGRRELRYDPVKRELAAR